MIGKEAAIENGQKWWEEKQGLQEQVNLLTVVNSRLKRKLNKVNELYEGLKMSFANVAKAVGMMKYSKKEYEQPLNERGNRLIDAITNYTSYWLRKMGNEDLAETKAVYSISLIGALLLLKSWNLASKYFSFVSLPR